MAEQYGVQRAIGTIARDLRNFRVPAVLVHERNRLSPDQMQTIVR